MSVQDKPLCVDLDGTLVRTDLLAESFFALIRLNFLHFFSVLGWLAKGRAYCKRQIANRVDLDVTTLPYNEALLDHLRTEQANGRSLALATASDEKYAHAVAEHLGIFERVFASDGQTNLKGDNKVIALTQAFGERGFDYAGDSRADLRVWRKARRAMPVSVSRSVLAKLEGNVEIDRVFNNPHVGLRSYLKAIRLSQWLKNLLVFLPLLLAHVADDPMLVGKSVIAFLAFGMCASSVYLLNDLLDLSHDRKHPTKRNRPLAAGTLSLKTAIMLIPLLLACAFGLAAFLPVEFLAVLGVYYIMTLGYSLRLKRIAMLDVLVLAFLYTLRIVAGAAAVTVVPSFWLLAFSTFLFLSLALVKRYTEFAVATPAEGLRGRGYVAVDKETVAQFGISSGFISALVLALYINGETVVEMYSRPGLLWALCPLLLYIIGRVWLLARRGMIDDDPVVFAAKDRRSQGCVVLGVLTLLAAI